MNIVYDNQAQHCILQTIQAVDLGHANGFKYLQLLCKNLIA